MAAVEQSAATNSLLEGALTEGGWASCSGQATTGNTVWVKFYSPLHAKRDIQQMLKPHCLAPSQEAAREEFSNCQRLPTLKLG